MWGAQALQNHRVEVEEVLSNSVGDFTAHCVEYMEQKAGAIDVALVPPLSVLDRRTGRKLRVQVSASVGLAE